MHPNLKNPLIFGSYTQVTQSELESLKTLVQQPITTRQLAQLGLLNAESSIAAQLTSPSGAKKKHTPVSSTETSTPSTSSSIQTSSIPQSTQSVSGSIITTSNQKNRLYDLKFHQLNRRKTKIP